MKHMFESHFEATVDRCRQERFVLAIQDTTTLNYTNLLTTQGLDKSGVRTRGYAITRNSETVYPLYHCSGCSRSTARNKENHMPYSARNQVCHIDSPVCGSRIRCIVFLLYCPV